MRFSSIYRLDFPNDNFRLLQLRLASLRTLSAFAHHIERAAAQSAPPTAAPSTANAAKLDPPLQDALRKLPDLLKAPEAIIANKGFRPDLWYVVTSAKDDVGQPITIRDGAMPLPPLRKQRGSFYIHATHE